MLQNCGNPIFGYLSLLGLFGVFSKLFVVCPHDYCTNLSTYDRCFTIAMNSAAERLLFIDPRGGRYDDARVGDLGRFLRAGDLLVVNDAATLPASLRATLSAAPHNGAGVEVRLMAPA